MFIQELASCPRINAERYMMSRDQIWFAPIAARVSEASFLRGRLCNLYTFWPASLSIL